MKKVDFSLTLSERSLVTSGKRTGHRRLRGAAQIPTLVGIELGAREIEVVVFDKSTKVRIKEVI